MRDIVNQMPSEPVAKPWTRRALLALPAALGASAEVGRAVPSAGIRYMDPATEFPVERLTDPNFPSLWPYPYARAIGKRGQFFVYASDRGEGLQAFRFELRNGESKQLTEAKALHPGTLNVLPDDRVLVYMDGDQLLLTPLGGSRPRQVYRIPEGWQLGEGFAVSGDGIYAALVERNGEQHRLRLVGLAKGNATTLVEGNEPLRHPQMRPRRASVLYHRGDALHLVGYDGTGDKRLGAAIATPGAAIWSPEGRTVLYLRAEERGVLLHESTPDTLQDVVLTRTSQYGNFSRNGDGSVFVAASRSVAQPHVVIMLRSVKRELTLCEHKASDPAMVTPVFSPTSQRIYFQSDRHGKPAIYSMVVDKLIEKTEESE